MKILMVEDEEKIATDVTTSLEAEGYVVDLCKDGEEAWFLGDTEDYDAVVLDLGLPKLDGLTILRRWRSENRAMPVIVLTARDNWTEKVEGINAGADDYLTKPFNIEELLARLRAVLRRTSGHASDFITMGDLQLDIKTQSIIVNNVPTQLTAMEFRLIRYFFYNQGRVIPASELLEHVYGENSLTNTNALEVLIARLRRKLGKDKIKTRRGQGYWMPDNP